MGKRSTISYPEYLAPVPERRARSLAAVADISTYMHKLYRVKYKQYNDLLMNNIV